MAQSREGHSARVWCLTSVAAVKGGGGALCNCATLRVAPFTANLLEPLQQNAALESSYPENMRTHELLQTQRNEVFLLIKKSGLQPTAFRWCEMPSAFTSDLFVPQLE